MSMQVSSRERLLAALNCEKPDHVPMAFMLFTALNQRLSEQRRGGDPALFIEEQRKLGLDVMVDLTFFVPQVPDVGHPDAPGCPVRFGKDVQTAESVRSGERGRPSLQKIYATPAGELSVTVERTADWPYPAPETGDLLVPFMDDYLAPRCSKYLVETEADLASLRHLLVPPTHDDLARCRDAWSRGKQLAQKYDLLLTGGWGVGGDALAWLCGLQNAVMMAIDRPAMLEELLSLIDAWNKQRMRAFLEFGVDLFIRRAWYEGTDLWSPQLFRRFFFPIIREEVRMTHQAGAKYGYILTSGSMALHEMLIELGVDVLIGPDPVQGKGTDLDQLGEQLRGRMCIWGGVNGSVTVELGAPEQIEAAVREAVTKLGPEGLILSPVDNIRDPSDATWQKVLLLIEAWKKYRG